jgi:hypothetical protein
MRNTEANNVSQKMNLLVKVEGGPFLGVLIVGERKDLIALADQLKTGAESKEEGRIGFSDAHVKGEPHEWLEFELVKNLAAARDEQKVKAAPAKLGVMLFVFAHSDTLMRSKRYT